MQPDSLKQVASAAATPSGIRDEVCGMRHAACNSTVRKRERVEEGYERDRHNYLSTRRGSQLKFDYVRCNATSKRHDVTQAHTLTHSLLHTHAKQQICWQRESVREKCASSCCWGNFLAFYANKPTKRGNLRIFLRTTPLARPLLTLKRNQQLNVFIFMPSWLFPSTPFGCISSSFSFSFSFYFGCFCRNVYDRQANTKFI